MTACTVAGKIVRPQCRALFIAVSNCTVNRSVSYPVGSVGREVVGG